MSESMILDGRIPTIGIKADTISEAFHLACLEVWRKGIRVPTPKHTEGMPLGFDAAVLVEIRFPMAEPRIHNKGFTDDFLGLEYYRLEVTHGIHDQWIKSISGNETAWDYTYHGRMANQFDTLIDVIELDWLKKGRFGRNYQLTTWRAPDDLNIDDPPCLQSIQFRLVKDEVADIWRLNWFVVFRSHDLFKGWFENTYAITDWQRLWAKQLSEELGIRIEVGSYISYSASLHLYGLYFQDTGLQERLQQMSSQPWQNFAKTTDFMLGDVKALRWLIAAQMDHEIKTSDKKASEQTLIEADYNLDDYPYPEEWDL